MGRASSLGALPFVAAHRGLRHRQPCPAGGQPGRQAAAVARRDGRRPSGAMATEPDQRSGDYLLWTDTAASLAPARRGIAISALLALVARRARSAILPRGRATLAPFVAAISLIPPITVLPILFIVFGLGETSKIALIVVGTAPVMIRVAGAGGHGHPARADRQGADARRLDLADASAASCCRRSCRG